MKKIFLFITFLICQQISADYPCNEYGTRCGYGYTPKNKTVKGVTGCWCEEM